MGRRVRRYNDSDREEGANERLAMMDVAVRVIENFCHRNGHPDIMDSGDVPRSAKELTTHETFCYRSALLFLQREFGRGWRENGQAVKDFDLPDDPLDGKNSKAPHPTK